MPLLCPCTWGSHRKHLYHPIPGQAKFTQFPSQLGQCKGPNTQLCYTVYFYTQELLGGPLHPSRVPPQTRTTQSAPVRRAGGGLAWGTEDKDDEPG